MDLQVSRKVEELKLKPNDFLLPLYEAIVNAIQSIEDAGNIKKGKIFIRVRRDKQQLQTIENDDYLFPIQEVEIEDNGLGFDDENFRAFNTAYTSKNASKGCKGVGRFTMLACFSFIEIKSRFAENGDFYQRDFRFDRKKEIDPSNGNKQESQTNSRQTLIRLSQYLPGFYEKSQVSTDDLVEGIIEHCLLYFLHDNAPLIFLEDDQTDKKIVVNDFVNQVIRFDREPHEWESEGERFVVYLIQRTDSRHHKIKFCANSRQVGKSLRLEDYAGAFGIPFEKEEEKYWLDVYVTGTYLDANVNSVRNAFDFPIGDDEQLTTDKFSLKQIAGLVASRVEQEYPEFVQYAEEAKAKRIIEYITNPKNPRLAYHHLIRRPETFKSIPGNLSDDKLEEHLHRINFQEGKDLNKKFEKLFSQKKRPKNYEDFSQTLRELLRNEAEFNKDKLADYLIRRKTVIKLFKKFLEFDENESYHLEEDLHNLIFTMGGDSNTVGFDMHNLWLLDERLAFHSFLASDQRLSKNPLIETNSAKEPDLLIFDHSFAFSDKPDHMNSLVVFEFKRPMRDLDNSKDEKLDEQIVGYIRELMDGKAKNYRGRFINLDKNTPKFAYVVCDLSNDLKASNVNYNQFKETPHGTLYKIHDSITLHVEVIPYEKLAEFAEKRHLAFFKALGIEGL